MSKTKRQRAAGKATAPFADYRDNHRSYWLPVEHPRHTEVLGSRVSSKYGELNWMQLDWGAWWIDGPAPHLFNAGGNYFHVECKDKEEGCVYRVRCWYAGGKYRGWPVESIGIGFKGGKLHWIVRTEKPKLLRAAKPKSKEKKRG